MTYTGDKKRDYDNRWRQERRMAWIEKNGPCQECGSLEDLEVDHIDPSTKLLHTREIWSRREEIRLLELEKCQVLCVVCHSKKSANEKRNTTRHGTYSMRKSGCKCNSCMQYVRDIKRASRAGISYQEYLAIRI